MPNDGICSSRVLTVFRGQGDEEINKPEEEVRPGCKIEVFWPEDHVWYPGIVGATGEDGRTKIQYDDGDEENVVLKEEKYRVFPSENEEEEDPQQQVTATLWKTVLLRHWTEKLGNNQHSDTAAMQAAALEKSTADNYERHWKKFVKFCTEENLRPQTGTAMLRDSNGLSIVLEKEKGKNHLLYCYDEYSKSNGRG
eukprot:gene34560-biopygen33365